MSDLIAAPADPQVVAEDPEQVIEEVRQPLVLITEQAVALSTAAAASLPRSKPTRGVIAALRAMFMSASEDAPPAPRHKTPRRPAVIEHPAIAPGMRRR